MRRTALILFFVVSTIGLAGAMEADQVLNRFFDVSGGAAQLTQVNALSFESNLAAWDISVSIAHGDNGEFLIKERDQVSGFDGKDDYWSEFHGMVSSMAEEQRSRFQEYTFLQFFFHDLLKSDGTVRSLDYIELSEQHGKKYHVLKDQKDDGTARKLYFNVETGFLDKMVETASHPALGQVQQISLLSNYRRTGDVTLFGSIEVSDLNSGQTLQPKTDIVDLQLNPGFASDYFRRPESSRKPAVVESGAIKAEVIHLSGRGSLIVNVAPDLLRNPNIESSHYKVTINDYEDTFTFYADLRNANVQRGERIAAFNETPALWLVKAYEGLANSVKVAVGDSVVLTPIALETTTDAVPQTEKPEETVSRKPVKPAPLPDATRIMNYRNFGNTGLKVSDISIGAGSLSDPLVVDYALDLGINYFDTAESYGRGMSETAIGQVAARRRDEMIICSKLVMNGSTKMQEVINRFENSLKRLQTTYIDVLMIHGGNPDAVNNPEIYKAFDKLKAEKKLRFTGVSSHGPDMTEMLWPVVRERKVDVILLSYDPVTYPDLPELLEAAESKGIGLVAMKIFNSARSADLEEFETGKYPFNIAALRWALADPYIDTCIPSASFVDHIDQYVRVSGYTGNTSHSTQSGSVPTSQTSVDVNNQDIPSGKDLLKGIESVMTPVGDVTVLQKDELWKHINGADQQYLNFGCDTLTVAYYQDPTEKYEISIEIYQMADADCGFGIYTSQKPPEIIPLTVGTEGYGSKSNLTFFQGRYYVQLSSDSTSPRAWDQLKSVAQVITGNIKDPKGIPAEFSRFPNPEFSPSDYQYYHTGILGISGLNRAFSAKTMTAGVPVTVYLFNTPVQPGKPACEEIFRDGYKKTGDGPLKTVSAGDISGVMGKLKYKGPVSLFNHSECCFVITGTDDLDTIEALLKTISVQNTP